ncbi:MAG TPA: PQQ-dependent sugar dehydrogenase [Dehalococcoidia bacterium]|nr:PQQ-dependent sugar dehydrogenase [Dehalococcoidia bacterium]
MAPRLLRFAIAVSGLAFATLAILTPGGASRAGDSLQGDADCNGLIGGSDALAVIIAVATENSPECDFAADIDCDGDVDEADALGILRHVGGIISNTADDGCTPIGQPLHLDTPPPSDPPTIVETPTPTVTPTPTPSAPPTPTNPPTTPIADGYGLQEVLAKAQLGVAGTDKVELAMIPSVESQAILALQTGQIFRISLTNSFAPVLWGNLTTLVNFDGNEQGLLSVALSPNFDGSGEVFAYYSVPDPRPANPWFTYLARFTATTNELHEASRETVIEIEEFDHRHQGGHIVFDFDDNLLLSLGDGGFSGDALEAAQNLNRLLGKVIRIDVSPLPYTIPPSNPFVGVGGGVREEIFAYGFRNPWRMTIDSATGEIWLGDVGEGKWEEVNHVVAGGNYGWDCFEGHEVFETPGPNDMCEGPFVTPRAVYGHNLGIAIIGGYVYRGSAMPELNGWYVYADYFTARVWAVNTADDGDPILLHDADCCITSFAEDDDGELLIVSKDEGIHRLVRN